MIKSILNVYDSILYFILYCFFSFELLLCLVVCLISNFNIALSLRWFFFTTGAIGEFHYYW